MRQVAVLGARSIVLGIFAMVHAFLSFSRGDNSILAFGAIAGIIGVLHVMSATGTVGGHRPFFFLAGTVALGIAGVSIVGGVVVGPALFSWALGVFGVVTGAAEMLGAGKSPDIPRNDHLFLGGVTVVLGLASLVEAGFPDWLSGTLVAWAAIGSVVAGTASVQWRDQMSARKDEGQTR